ncbi:MAG: T9SS type A sorting domain-containing protein [Bacteroidota bacterium]
MKNKEYAYFTTNDFRNSLYYTDGLSNGTAPIKGLTTGMNWVKGNENGVYALGGRTLYFCNGDQLEEIPWSGGFISNIIPLDSDRVLIVAAGDDTDEVWVSNRTVEGTTKLYELNYFFFDEEILTTKYQDQMILYVSLTDNGRILPYITNGTLEGTQPLINYAQSLDSSMLKIVGVGQANDFLFLSGQTKNRTTDIMITDGTVEGTKFLDKFIGQVEKVAHMYDQVFFIQTDRESHLYDYETNTTQSLNDQSSFSDAVVLGNQAFFTDGGMVWTPDSLGKGPILVFEQGVFANGLAIATADEETYYLTITDADSKDVEIWSYNKSTQESAYVTTPFYHDPQFSVVQHFNYLLAINDQLIYRAFTQQHGHELWHLTASQNTGSGGTSSTYALSSLGLGIGPNPFTDAVYFTGDTNELNGAELRVVDMAGKTWYSGPFQQDLFLLHLPKGLFTIVITKDQRSYFTRVIKQ